MPSVNRWRRAQEFERSWWQRVSGRIEAGVGKQINYHGWKAGEMEKRLAGFLNDDQKKAARVLEVGCGPVGIVSFLRWGKRYAIDPLEDFYRSNPGLTKCRNPQVQYVTGTGEKLPFQDASFSLVILDNVLDHVQAADRVLNEVYRIVSDNGLLYFAVNVRTVNGALLHSLLAMLQIDKGHPYSFTITRIQKFLGCCGFKIRLESIADSREARRRDRTAPSLRDKIKGYTGLSEFVYYAVCSKGPQDHCPGG